MRKLAIIGMAFLISGCATERMKNAWEHYDACSVENTKFEDMVSCGKALRTTYCKKLNRCSAGGNAIVKFADTLVASVNSNEMTENEANLRWIEFRNKADHEWKAKEIEALKAIIMTW